MTSTPTINLMAAPKGGVGKTFIASLIAQAYRRQKRGSELVLVDADTNNASLASITDLAAQRVPLYVDNEIDKTAMDPLINKMLSDDKSYLIDTGGAAFHELTKYFTMLNLADAIKAAGKRLVVHTVIVGGGELNDCIAGFTAVMKWLPPSADAVLWVNEYRGPAARNGVHFLEGELFERYKSRLSRIGRLPKLERAFLPTTESLVNSRITIDSALEELKNDPSQKVEYQKLLSVSQLLFSAIESVYPPAKAA